jgi:PAS domain-containing protein
MGPPGRVASTWRRLGGLLPLLVAALLLTATILAATLAPRRFQSLVQADRTALDEVVGPARTLVSELQASLDREAASVSGYLLDRDIGHKERYRQAREREDSLVLQLAPLARRLGTPAVAQLDDLRRRMTEWHEDQEQLLLGVPGFAPEYLRRLPAQEARYADVRLATERLDGTLATAESVRRARIEELRRLEPPVMRGLAWLAGAAVLATLLMAGRLVMLSGRPQRGVLEASERRFGELAGSIREVFWIRDAETGRFTYISPAYEDVWGRSREPLHAGFGPFLATVHPEDRDRVEAAEPPGEIEYRIVRPDGTIRWIAERSLRLSD